MAATSGSFPGTLPDVSTSRTADPDPVTARPTVVVDRARGTAERPDTEIGVVAGFSRLAPGRHRPGGDPEHGRPAPGWRARCRSQTEVAPGNPLQTAEPAKDDKKPAASTPPGQQKDKEKENQGKKPAGPRRRRTVRKQRSRRQPAQRHGQAAAGEGGAGMSGPKHSPSPIRPRRGDFPLSWNSAELRPGIQLVTVAGELDILTAPTLLVALQRPEHIEATHSSSTSCGWTSSPAPGSIP